MSQHDYVLENQSGANFRLDTNSVLSAIVTNNSGITEPPVTFANMLWADTTSGWMKQRDLTNTSWAKKFPLGNNSFVTIASSSTIDLTVNAVTSDYVKITGTTSITSITLENGQRKTLIADGIFTLVNSATLILPGGINFVTKVGDIIDVIGESGGIVHVDVNTTSLPSPGTAGNLLTSNGTIWTSAALVVPDNTITPSKLTQKITLGTAVATTSGTAVDFTGIPSWAKRITVSLVGVSTNGSAGLQIRLGTSSGIVSTGYLGSSESTLNSTGFELNSGSSAPSASYHGMAILSVVSSDGATWSLGATISRSDSAASFASSGSKILPGILDRIRLTTSNGTDTFDAGSVNILYEG